MLNQKRKEKRKILTQNILEILDTKKRPNLRIKEEEETQVKDTENTFKKIIDESFPNLKKEMSIKVQEGFRGCQDGRVV